MQVEEQLEVLWNYFKNPPWKIIRQKKAIASQIKDSDTVHKVVCLYFDRCVDPHASDDRIYDAFLSVLCLVEKAEILTGALVESISWDLGKPADKIAPHSYRRATDDIRLLLQAEAIALGQPIQDEQQIDKAIIDRLKLVAESLLPAIAYRYRLKEAVKRIDGFERSIISFRESSNPCIAEYAKNAEQSFRKYCGDWALGGSKTQNI